MPSLAPYAANSYVPYSPSSAVQAASALVSPIASVRLSDPAFASELTSARMLRAVAEPVAQCGTWLPQASPVEVQIDGRTVMRLHSEPDRVAFLNENRASALWMEMLDAVRPVNGCPVDSSSSAVTADIEARMACLGIGGPDLRRGDAASFAREPSASDAGERQNAGVRVGASEFATVEALSLPSVYIREAGFEPGTMAALEYDLGWRALAPSWHAVMPVIDEIMWQENPNPELFCGVGRAILPHLATTSSGAVSDALSERIVSFHMHAGGLIDCLANATQSVERTGTDGQVREVAAFDVSDFLRDCAGADWRVMLTGRAGEDALTHQREACEQPSTLAPTSQAPVEDTESPDDDVSVLGLRR